MLNSHLQRQRAQRGLSIVELLVGVAVGLFIVAGSTKLFVDYLSNNRGLLLETRINQDLRAAADLVARDLRRASYWRNAEAGLSSTLGVPAVDNPYKAVNYDGGSGVLTYSYAKDNVDAIDASTEDFRVRRTVKAVVSGWRCHVALADGPFVQGIARTIIGPTRVATPSGSRCHSAIAS